MEYEKKYKEALEVAKRKLCFDKAGMVDSFTPDDIYEMFPELKESEDEKIRKELIGFLRNIPNSNYTCEEMALWLEKQGVQPLYNIGDVICDKSCTTLNKEAQPNMEIVDIKNGAYICDKGSFPVSQQDEYELVSKKIDTKLNDDSVSNELRAASVKHAEKELKNHTFPNNEEFELVYTFEEGAKWNAAQKHNWSEEDEYRTGELLGWLNTLINYIQGDATVSLDLYRERERQVEIIKTWIKSLKAQNTWKPSDEQMEELSYAVSVMASSKFVVDDYCYDVLKSLRDQLKKLK
jgi:hypothetical protein